MSNSNAEVKVLLGEEIKCRKIKSNNIKGLRSHATNCMTIIFNG
jgi:hypothetical protein